MTSPQIVLGENDMVNIGLDIGGVVGGTPLDDDETAFVRIVADMTATHKLSSVNVLQLPVVALG